MMTVYRRGQLYCVAKSSSLETKGDSGVEVLANEPYHDDETGQDGQYTYKVYHLGSRLPGWIAALAPAGALKLEERAWNAFPYCKTELSLPVLGDRFTFRIESKYFDDDLGAQENVFGLAAADLPAREVDKQDFTDSSLISPEDYKEDTDPTKFHSEKTGRGPLVKGEWQATTKPLMCAYKLVSVEFRWWGLQTRIQSFIMGTMTGMLAKFHRQMFCWIDEWIELTMEQVREYETQVQEEMRQKLDTSNEPPTPDVILPPPTPVEGALESSSTPKLTSESTPKLTSSSTPKLATASTSTPKLEGDPAPQKSGWGWW